MAKASWLDKGMSTVSLSFVAPAFNEEKNVAPLCDRISKTCDELGIDDYEVVLVENGSKDRTAEVIAGLTEKNPRIKMVQLSRNFGYQGGIAAGLNYAKGGWVVVLDSDQQDPPELVKDMLVLAESDGLDVVYGYREKRVETLSRKVLFWGFYRVWAAISEIEVPLDAGEFCLMRRKVVDAINNMPESQRFMRGLRAWTGFRQGGLAYERAGRIEGTTSFNLVRAMNLALDGLLAFSRVPLRLMMIVGVFVLALCSLLVLLNVTAYFLNLVGVKVSLGFMPPGLTQVNVLLIIMFGFNLICFGVVGEYVGRVYDEVKRRPHFLVNRIIDNSRI
jgi:glycosyltransferase involved in cell wall biosynthesis